MKWIRLIFLALLFATNAAAQDSGFFVRSNCTAITAPVANSTACLQTTTTGGRTAGQLYVWNGSSYVALSIPTGTQSANTVFAGPASGAAAAPAFRVEVADDVPDIPASKITSGTLPVARGGTNASSFTGSRCLETNAGGTAIQSSSGPCAGSTTFDQVGAGTNTTAAMVLGSGSSLTTSGTGTNTATAVKGLTASRPLVSDGSGNLAAGSGFTGNNSTTVVTSTGTQTSGDCVTIDANGNHVAAGGACGIAGAGYATIQDEGSNLTARTTMNFAGAGVAAVDDAGNSRTNITIPGGMTALTGDVTASGTGSQAATIANAAVTLAKIQNAAANSKLLGSGDSGSGSSYAELTLGTNLSMSGTTLNAAGGGGGGLTLVENKTVTSNSTTVTFSGLDGNADGTYFLAGRIKNNSGGATFYSWFPNGLTTNLGSEWTADDGGGVGAGSSALVLSRNDSAKPIASSYSQFQIVIFAKKDPNSQAYPLTYKGSGTNWDGTTFKWNGHIDGIWNETSTNLTSIDVTSADANGIGNGSIISLYKYAQ